MSTFSSPLPDTLVESELFGIEKGVATGVESRRGKFEAAGGGTLFLDEIADLSLPSQAKILRALQERAVERVGGHRTIPVDVRVIAATNKDLEREIENETFRGDLYYRLNVVHIRLPVLRDIAEDIPLLVSHFITRHGAAGRPEDLSPAALRLLMDYPWPGNIRQLENEVRWWLASCRRRIVEPEDLSEAIRSAPARDTGLRPYSIELAVRPTLAATVGDLETKLVRDAMTETRGNQVRAAALLGLSRQGLVNKLKRYKIRDAR